MPKEEFKNSLEDNILKEAYLMLKVNEPFELSQKFLEEDQKLMQSNSWDYNNSNLVVNKVKNILETIDVANLSEKEKAWRNEILWLWYHHAINCTIKHRDIEKAKEYALKALEYQSKDNPNKITKLLYFLVNDKIEEAEDFVKNIGEDKQTGLDLIKSYKNVWSGF